MAQEVEQVQSQEEKEGGGRWRKGLRKRRKKKGRMKIMVDNDVCSKRDLICLNFCIMVVL
jgi:hypothetical protein